MDNGYAKIDGADVKLDAVSGGMKIRYAVVYNVPTRFTAFRPMHKKKRQKKKEQQKRGNLVGFVDFSEN